MSEGNTHSQKSRDLIKGALIRIEELESELESLKAEKNEPIAVIGMGCRFPKGIDNPQALWDLLFRGESIIDEVPENRWNINELYSPDLDAPGKMNSRFGGFIENVADFDAAFFGISPREAASMDPQQRLLLEVSWEALENANIDPLSLYGSSAGIFIGIIAYDYGQRLLGSNRLNDIDAYAGTGSSLGVAAGRLSYTLGLTGPSLSVDTACSSSLVTVHLACQSLKRGECNLAIAGGVNLMLEPGLSVNFSKAHMLAPDGKCKTFDSAADGYVRGEGCGVVVLKRLRDALENNDPILALIKGSAVNQDGASGGLTIPSGPSQAAVINQALKNAECEPNSVDYIEAHGTGTALGDPIELGSLDQVFSSKRDHQHPLLIGSIKTNIGHLEAAAGIAGIIKLILSLKNEYLPPHLNCSNPTTRFPWDKRPIEIVQESKKWPRTEKKRIAGISSFGFSGTNAHILLEEAPVSLEKSKNNLGIEEATQVLCLSGQSLDALHAQASNFLDFVKNNKRIDLYQLCASVAHSRGNLKYRLNILARSPKELEEYLEAYLKKEILPEIISAPEYETPSKEIAFLFTGQGSQYPEMGRDLYETQPNFKHWIDQCEQILSKHCDIPLTKLLFESDDEILSQSLYTQPSLFCLEYSLAKFWQSLGIHPSILIGHSLGEYVAACIAGIFSLEDAIAIICKRASLMQALPQDGAMAAISTSADSLATILRDYKDTISIAAINSSQICVISGKRASVEKIILQLNSQQISSRLLSVSHAFHSQLMEPMLGEFEDFLAQIPFSQAQIPIISNVTGLLADPSISSPAYWVKHIREPVLFAKSLETLKENGIGICIEIGPSPTLCSMAKESLEDILLLPSLKPKQASDWQFLRALAQLNVINLPIQWEAIYPRSSLVHFQLPNYPFQKEHYWIERAGIMPSTSISTTRGHPLIGAPISLPGLEKEQLRYQNQFNSELPFLSEHLVFTNPILPATALIEMALASMVNQDKPLPIAIENFEIDRAFNLASHGSTQMQLVLRPENLENHFDIYSSIPSSQSQKQQWFLNAHGNIKQLKKIIPISLNIKELQERLTKTVGVKEFYELCKTLGIEYGSSYQLITNLRRNENEVLAHISLTNEHIKQFDSYSAYPPLLDACLQTIFSLLPTLSENVIWLPIGIEHFEIYQALPRDIFCYVTLKTQDKDLIQAADIVVTSIEGEVICTITNLKAKKTQLSQFNNPISSSATLNQLLYETEWRLHDIEPIKNIAPETNQRSKWLIFADHNTLTESFINICQANSVDYILVSKEQEYLKKDLQHFCINPYQREHYVTLLSDLAAIHIDRCIYLWGLDSLKSLDSQDPLADQLRLMWQAPLYLAQALQMQSFSRPLKLFFVTRNAFAVNANQNINIEYSLLIGIAKSITAELPDWDTSVLDLEVDHLSSGISMDSQYLYQEIAQTVNPMVENEVAFRHSQRYVSRLVQADSIKPPPPTPYHLTIPSSGSLADLAWQTCERQTPLADEVEIEVQTTGLNFKDVLLALHRVSALGTGLGVECAGKIVSVGPGVTQFAVGQRVLAMVPGSLSRFVCAPVATTAVLPPELTEAAAATIPITFLTAAYALESLAHIKPGERVLIHAGTGGVGQAAIQIAQGAGAEVFATASQGKWQILKDLGVQHIFDSRSTAFEAAIQELTQGQGVDVVLNSLRGEFTDASLRLLSPGGRFLEIGITDLRTPEQVEQIAPGIAYFPIDLMDLYRDQRPILQTLLQELMARFAQQELKPLPYQLYPANAVETAFRTMQQAKHTGKVVIDLQESPVVKGEAQYLILGGLGDLGLSMAKWLTDKQAKHIVLVSRTTPSAEKLRHIEALRDSGTEIEIIQCDIRKAGDIEILFSKLAKSSYQLKGIFQCAGVLDDAMLAQQNEQRFANVLLPKVDSSWLIHQHTKNLSLDFFVLFSSATSMLGSPGQANYIAANSFLDSLAHLRKAEGLPATSINWGAWDSIGMAARMNLQDQLAKLGIKTITPNIAHQLLDEILQISPAQIGAFAIDWKVYLGNNNRRAFFNEVVEETDALDPNSANTTQSSFLNEFKAIHQDEHISFIHNHIAKCVAAVLGIPKSRKIDRKQGFFDLGMDSLTSVELKNRLSTDLGMNLPATLAFDHPNINALAEHLLSRLTQLTVAPLDPAQQTREDHTKQVAELSEEEAEETLKRALKEMGFENK